MLPVLAGAGLLELLDPLLISRLTGLVKPDPRPFARLTRLGIPPDRVLYVDDRPHALRRAERQGLATLHAGTDRAWTAHVSARLGRAAEARAE